MKIDNKPEFNYVEILNFKFKKHFYKTKTNKNMYLNFRRDKILLFSI